MELFGDGPPKQPTDGQIELIIPLNVDILNVACGVLEIFGPLFIIRWLVGQYTGFSSV